MSINIAMIIINAKLSEKPEFHFEEHLSSSGNTIEETCEDPWDKVETLRKIYFVALIVNVVALFGTMIVGNCQTRQYLVS